MGSRASKLRPVSDSSMPPELVTTKLRIPLTRPDLVPRERLIRLLAQPAPRKLALVSAPAGFGKTTLVATWARQSPKAVGWVSLDAGDNDSARFWTYFVTALQGLYPRLAQEVPLNLHAVSSGSLEDFLITLINEISALPLELALVLDDYHLIVEDSIHRAMNYLLVHQPPQMQLIIVSREDPPLSLSRLRARGELLELRAAELRFTPEEASAFLGHTMDLHLSPEDVAALEARTEGWIAGLQLAALSVRGRQDVSSFVDAFTGSQRYVLDYLGDEVFYRLPEETREFLLLTSILDRLCAPLCDAVTGAPGPNSHEILHRLEKENLFLVPLDEQRQWYRYHHLFADFLRSLLERTRGDQVKRLHERACEWLAAHGSSSEALEHALAAEDYPRAAHLVEGLSEDTIKRGEMTTLSRWMRALPEEYIRPNPRLCLAYGWALFGIGDLDGAEARLVDAEAILAEGGNPQDVAAEIAALRSMTAALQGDMYGALELSQRASANIPAGNNSVASVVALMLGIAYDLSGDSSAARRSYLEATEMGQSAGNVMVTIGALAQLGDLQATRGELRYAVHLYQQALQMDIEESGWSLLNSAAHIGLGRVLLEWNDLEEARHHIEKGVHQLENWGGLGAWYANVGLSQMRLAMGDQEGAMAALLRVERSSAALRSRLGEAGVNLMAEVMSSLEAQAWLLSGQLDRARGWAGKVKWDPEEPLSYIRQYRDSTLGRVLFAEGRHEEAVAVLSALVAAAEAAGYWGVVIDTLPTLALALEARGEGKTALATLRRALSLAEPEGYVRTFIQNGAPMSALLSRLLETLHGEKTAESNASPSRAYVESLLAAFPTGYQPIAVSTQRSGRGPHPLSPDTQPPPHLLSQRELELLRLAAEGMSSREIAADLIIAEGTVKRHLHNIYGKLGATSRTQAIAAARRLGILAG